MQETMHSQFIADKNPTDSDKGEPVSAFKNTYDKFRCRCRPTLPDGQTDKYDLDLRFRPRHRDKIVTPQDCVTFQKWDGQNSEKFGFIPLGDLMLPSIDLKNVTKEKIFDVHRRIKASGTLTS